MPPDRTISWREIPLFRLLLPFVLGIGLGWAFPIAGGLSYWLVGLIVFGLSVFYFGIGRLAIQRNLVWGAAVSIWLVLFGYWHTVQHKQLIQASHFSQQEIFADTLLFDWSAQVKEVRAGTSNWRVQVQVNAFARPDSAQVVPCKGKLLLYLPADESGVALLPGQNIHFRTKVQGLQSPLNPDAFDFAAWQAKQNVFHQARIDASQWRLADDGLSIIGYAYQFRERLLAILSTHLTPGSNELAVGAALILGKRDELTSDLRNAYAETGAVHVLAVSGLHLGFIAWGLAWLFGWGPFKRRSWRWVQLLLVLTGIWAFAVVTGLSPSVQRAAIMFSAVWIGKLLGRQSSVYNALAASAFLMLLINPYLLFDIGFQLSYLALLGIVFFQRRLYSLFYSPYFLVDKAWQLSTVAIAAQLTTFPLTLYYFHQFPLYFLLSGLVVVLAASLILGLGILLFLFSWFGPLAGCIGFLLETVLWLNNAFIFGLQQLPGHLVSGIWINEAILLFLFVSLFLFARYSLNRQVKTLMAGLVALVLVLSINMWMGYSTKQQRRWVVYHQYKETVIDAIDGRRRFTISSLAEQDPVLDWGIRPHREKRAVSLQENEQPIHWFENPPIYGFYDQRIAVIDRDWKPSFVPENPLQVDLLVLRNSPYYELSELSTYFQAEQWICDGSNFPSRVKSWIKEADRLGLSLHWTSRDGAYQKDF